MLDTDFAAYHINVTVQAHDGDVHLLRGTPAEMGLEDVSHHMILSRGDDEIMLWFVGKIDAAEKENVIQGVLEYLDESGNVADSQF
jgi:hypothetical protein